MKTLLHGARTLTLGILSMPFVWRLWVLLLGAVNVAPALFFPDRVETQVTLLVMLASALLMSLLAGIFGFTRILGAAAGDQHPD